MTENNTEPKNNADRLTNPLEEKKAESLNQASFEEAVRHISAKEPEPLLDQSKFDVDQTKKRIENSLLEQELQLKGRICDWVIKTVSNYLITVFSLIVTATVLFPLFKLETYLSDQVLITLLTTTTISLIGLPTLIIKSLFPSRNKMQRTTEQNL